MAGGKALGWAVAIAAGVGLAAYAYSRAKQNSVGSPYPVCGWPVTTGGALMELSKPVEDGTASGYAYSKVVVQGYHPNTTVNANPHGTTYGSGVGPRPDWATGGQHTLPSRMGKIAGYLVAE